MRDVEPAWVDARRDFSMSKIRRKKERLPFTNRQGALVLVALAALLILLLAITMHWS